MYVITAAPLGGHMDEALVWQVCPCQDMEPFGVRGRRIKKDASSP